MITFKEFLKLCEQPTMSDENLRGDSNPYKIHSIMSNHHEANDLGNGHFHLNDGDDHFYHMTSGKIDALSTVSENEHGNVHETFFKEAGVDSNIPLQNFKNALHHFGEITSDVSHTKGSKHFWMNLHDKIPRVKIHVTHGNSERVLHSKEDLKRKESSIWGDSDARLYASI